MNSSLSNDRRENSKRIWKKGKSATRYRWNPIVGPNCSWACPTSYNYFLNWTLSHPHTKKEFAMGAAPTYCALFSLLVKQQYWIFVIDYLLIFLTSCVFLKVATNLALSFHRATDDSCSEFHVDQTQCQPYLSFNGETTKPPLLVVSLDGFRSDYLERLAETSKTNGLLRLARCGVKAASMIPVFPTVTLPNHYSIVTVYKSYSTLPEGGF